MSQKKLAGPRTEEMQFFFYTTQVFHVLWYRVFKNKHENWINKVKPDSWEEYGQIGFKLRIKALVLQYKVRFECRSRASFNRAVWHIAPSDSAIWQRMDTRSLRLHPSVSQRQTAFDTACVSLCVFMCVCADTCVYVSVSVIYKAADSGGCHVNSSSVVLKSSQ